MGKRIVSTVIALIFFVSTLVFPASSYPMGSETTENGYPIPDLCTRTNEPYVTNYCFELKRVLPGNVVKDGVIGEDEYYHLDIPRDEIILKGSNIDPTTPALERSQAMKESVEAYVSWDYEHGVNFAVQYTSPETPVQQFSSLYYDGRVTPLPGSTKDNPLYNDSFNDDGSFKAIGDDFWAQTAFTCQFSDRTGRAFYYNVGRNTDTGEYLMGHYFFSDLSGNGWGQYGYDPTYIPVGGEDLIITYGPDNLVTMEWSVPFSTILGRDPEDGEKIGFSMTLTQGTTPPDADQPWRGDLENNAAILLGNCAGFQSLAAKPTRTKTQKVQDPVTDELITKKTGGNLPMVAIFNTTAPEGGEPEPDPMIEEIDDRYDELACVAHGLLDLVFGTSATVYSLPDVLTEIFGYPASMDPDDIEEIKSDYGGLGDGQTAWPGEYTVTFTNPDTGATYDKDIDFSLYKAVGGKYCGAIVDQGFLGCCPDEWPDDAVAARNAVDDRHSTGWPDYWNSEDIFTIDGDEYTEEAIEAWYRDVTGLGDGWEFYIENFDETKAYEGNAVNIGLRNDDIKEEGRTVIIYCAPTLKIAATSHTHNYLPEVTAPTCSEQGYTTYTCSVCGDAYVDDYVDPIPHTYESVVTPPTCSEQGYTTYTCSVCGAYYVDDYVDALPHTFESVVTAPTCSDQGYTTYTCSVCGYSYLDDYVDPVPHMYESTVTPPTCSEQGYTTYTCSVCGAYYVDDYVDALPHTYESVVTAPTCSEQGYTTYTCSVCGAYYVGDYVETVPHTYESTVTPPTCSEQGYTTYTCSVCGAYYVDDYVDALPHTYEAVVTEPTCTERGYTTYTCSVCGHSYVDDYVDALPHTYESVVTPPTCSEQGYTTYTCSVCGDFYVDDYVETVPHTYESVVTEPTCTERGYTTYTCSVCGDYYIDDYVDTVPHTYESVVTPPTCTEMGYTTYTCSVCGNNYVGDYVGTAPHTYEAVVTPPTCTEQGYTTYTCSVCGDYYVDTFTDALGHVPAEAALENETAATCTADGSYDEVVYCSVCGEELSRQTFAVPSTGHVYSNGACTVCGAPDPAAAHQTVVPDGYVPIYDEFDLYYVRNDMTANYIMMADVDLTEALASGGNLYNPSGWIALGYVSGGDNVPFTGTFDGNGYSIIGITGKGDSAGLFTENSGTIKNLTIASGKIYNETGVCGGAFSKTNLGVIENCINYADVAGRSCGGIVYSNSGIVKSCGNYGSINSYADYYTWCGGIAAKNSGSIEKSFNRGSVKGYAYSGAGHYTMVGGISGSSDGTVSDCYNVGELSNGYSNLGGWYPEAYLGGIVGSASGDGIFRCYNAGAISGNSSVANPLRSGGIAGSCYSTITNCYYLSNMDQGVGSSSSADPCISLSDALMQRQQSFTGFDFDTVWTMGTGDYLYPVFRHEHVLTHYEAVDPSCTEGGNIEYWFCEECGGYFTDAEGTLSVAESDVILPALGHLLESDPGVEPTCTEPGRASGCSCTRCGYIESGCAAVDPLGHEYAAVITAPTCTEQGFTTHTCSRCGDFYVDGYVEAIGHEYVAVVTAPTCTEQGCTTHTCSICGDFYIDDYVDALGHNFVGGVCTVCGEPDPNCAAVTVEDVRAKAGDEITVDVSIENAPALSSVAISDITLDSPVLTLLGVEWDVDNLVISSWDENTGMGVAALSETRDINGTIVTLTIKVSDDAEDGDYSVTLSVRGKGANNADVAFVTEPGTVTVWSVMRGDLNGDEIVSDADAVYLLFYTFFPETYPLNQDGDFNGDGEVTDADAVYLLFYTFFPDTYPLN
ncbi:MAG: hypothetical protein IJM71_04635 [Clostridia bacterium]|nr:hypothetical protein [Clostridia bacterium]